MNPEHVDGLITDKEAGKAGLRYADYNHDGYMDKGESEQVQSDPKDKFDEADRSNPDHIDGLINDKEARDYHLRYADYDFNGVMDGGESQRAQAGPKDAFDEADFSNPDHIDGLISPEEAALKYIGFVDPNGDGLMSRPEYEDALSKVLSQGINPGTFFRGGFANIDVAKGYAVDVTNHKATPGPDGFFGTDDLQVAASYDGFGLTPEEKAAAQTALQWMEAAKGTGTAAAAEEAKAMLQISGFKYDEQTGQWGHAYDKSATTQMHSGISDRCTGMDIEPIDNPWKQDPPPSPSANEGAGH